MSFSVSLNSKPNLNNCKLTFLVSSIMISITSCSGGGSASFSRPSVLASPTASASGGVATQSTAITLTIPVKGRTTNLHKHKRNYVSPSSASAVVNVNGQVADTANLGPAMPGCSAVEDSEFTCSLPVNAPSGAVTIEVSVYDGLDGAGNLLSQGTTSGTFSALGQEFPITLDSYVSSATVSVNPTVIPVFVQNSAIAISVNAFDADGNPIVGPGNYINPLTVSASGATTAVMLQNGLFTAPGQVLNATYDGTLSSGAAFTASASGVSSSQLTSANLIVNDDRPLADTNSYTYDESYSFSDGQGGTITGSQSDAETVTIAENQSFFPTGPEPWPSAPPDLITATISAYGSTGNSSFMSVDPNVSNGTGTVTFYGSGQPTVSDDYYAQVFSTPYSLETINGAAGQPVLVGVANEIFSSYDADDGNGPEVTTLATNSDGSSTEIETQGSDTVTTDMNTDGTSSMVVTTPGQCNPEVITSQTTTFAAPTVTFTQGINDSENEVGQLTCTGSNDVDDITYFGGYPASLPSSLATTTIQDLGSASLPTSCPDSAAYPGQLHEIETVSNSYYIFDVPFPTSESVTTEDDFLMNNIGLVCSVTTYASTGAASISNSPISYDPQYQTPPPQSEIPVASGLATTIEETVSLGLNSATLQPYAVRRERSRVPFNPSIGTVVSSHQAMIVASLQHLRACQNRSRGRTKTTKPCKFSMPTLRDSIVGFKESADRLNRRLK